MEHLASDRSGRKHNLNEVLTLRSYRHPSIQTQCLILCCRSLFFVADIVQFIASYRLKDEIWIAMEFLEGGTLEMALQSTKFTEPQIAYITREIFKALAFLHGKHRAHRDLKGANVMISVSGAVKLIDFGLSAGRAKCRRLIVETF
jgi:serine/threonine protein kinase